MRKIIAFLLTFVLLTTGMAIKNTAVTKAWAGGTITEVQVHVQNIGWMQWNETFAGTTGKGLRIEAIKIRFKSQYRNQPNLHVQYRVHVENIGWMPWVRDGKLAGTTGRSLKIEAFQVMIVDDKGNQKYGYSIGSEACHIENLGWVAGNGDGKTIGTTGKNLRLEAFNLFSNKYK